MKSAILTTFTYREASNTAELASVEDVNIPTSFYHEDYRSDTENEGSGNDDENSN